MADAADEQRPEPLMREALDLFGEYQRTGGGPLITRATRTTAATATCSG